MAVGEEAKVNEAFWKAGCLRHRMMARSETRSVRNGDKGSDKGSRKEQLRRGVTSAADDATIHFHSPSRPSSSIAFLTTFFLGVVGIRSLNHNIYI